MVVISWFILAATISLPTLIALDVLQDGVSLAAAFAVLTVIVAEAILTRAVPALPKETGLGRQFVLIGSTLAASIVLSFKIRFLALPIMALPILTNAAVDDTVALFV